MNFTLAVDIKFAWQKWMCSSAVTVNLWRGRRKYIIILKIKCNEIRGSSSFVLVGFFGCCFCFLVGDGGDVFSLHWLEI